jgi:hypothetical protein
MYVDPVILSVDLLSACATGALVVLTAKPCKLSNVPYLLGIPAGFGLITVAFLAQAIAALIDIPPTGFVLNFIYLLTQTYGLLFLAFTYARRTRMRWIGESRPVELGVAIAITLTLFAAIFLSNIQLSPNELPVGVIFFLQTVTVLSTVYIVYEAVRSWSILRKPVEGYAAIAFALLFAGQVGFILATSGLGAVAVFVGYEGRLLGLFVLNALILVGVKKNDFMTVLKRLGLGAPAH